MTYKDRLIEAILKVHGCAATYIKTVPIWEKFKGETVWRGKVEVFDITGNPHTERCYAWGYREAGRWMVVAVLNLPPVRDARSAVQAAIAASADRSTKRRNF